MAERKLTPKQERFVQEYLIDLNAAAAYRRAGYAAKTDHQASANAARLMANDSIQAAIAAAQSTLANKLDIDAAKVLSEYAAIAFCEVDLAEVKAADKLKALEALGKHLGLFKDDEPDRPDLDVHFQITVIQGDAKDPVQSVSGAGSVS